MYSYYEQASSTNPIPLSVALSALPAYGVQPPVNGETKLQPFPLVNLTAGLSSLLPPNNQNNTIPKAYLAIVQYNEQNVIVGQTFSAVSTSSLLNWIEHNLEFTATANGRIEVFVANESNTSVWFDDMEVALTGTMIVQETHYDPWGMELVGIGKKGAPQNKFSYNGKEKTEDFGLNWLSYGQREYDPCLGRFFVIDRFADKYFDFSPYQYGGNNPIMNIDINGDSIWIASGKDKVLYTIGMQYNGKDTFVAATVEYLNGMAESNAGKSVLSDLSKSKNPFDFKNTPSSGGANSAQFARKDAQGNFLPEYKNGGGEIRAAFLMNQGYNDNQKIEVVSHELYHGYQTEKGANPYSVNAEVEAYLFQTVVNTERNQPLSSLGTNTPNGMLYHQSIDNMVVQEATFNPKTFNDAVHRFKTGSVANTVTNPKTGKPIYDSHPIDNNYKITINNFLPAK